MQAARCKRSRMRMWEQFYVQACGYNPRAGGEGPGGNEQHVLSIIGGHAVVLAGYDANGARLISWGSYYAMTWRFFAKYVDEVYAIADPDWISSKGTTPGGLSLQALQAQMKALAQG
jgi:hypothetical protein